MGISLYLILRRSDRMQYELPSLPPIDMEQLDYVELVTNDRTVKLVKNGGEWRLEPEGYKADSSEVTQLLRSISSLTLTDLVSITENYRRYDLEEGTRIRVTAYQSEELVRQFDVGKQSPSYNHTYVAIRDDKRVFQANGDFRGNFDKTKDDLRDLLVLTFDKEKIIEIGVKTDEKSLRLTKTATQASKTSSDDGTESEEQEKTVWQTETDETWNTETIDNLLEQLSNLECMQYYKGDESSLESPIIELNLIGADNYQLKIYSQQEEKHPARSSQNDYTFLLSSWNRDTIVRAFEIDDEE